MVPLLAWAIGGQVSEARQVGQGLARVVDPWSDAASLRSAQAYLALGFWRDAGLPRVLYGPDFRQVEGYPDLLPRQDDMVYLHYPPGPNWLATAAMAVAGADRVWLIRCLPIIVAALALAALAWALIREDGSVRAAAVIAGVLAAPMATNMMGNLHMHSYALSLLWVQAAVCIRLFGIHPGRGAWLHAALLALGFGQGWLSFDYAFLVALTPIPLWLLAAKRHPWRRMAWAVAWCVVGFALAHGLHFLEVVAHLGGWGVALEHFRAVAAERSFAGPVHRGAVNWTLYLCLNLVDHKNLFGFALSVAALGAGALCLMPRRRWSLRSPSFRIEFRCTPRARLAIVAALAVSGLWLVAMRSHALEHHYFVLRHFALAHLCCLLLVARGVRVRGARVSLAPSAAAGA